MFDLLNIHLFHDASNLVSIELVSDKNNITWIIIEDYVNNTMVKSTIPNLKLKTWILFWFIISSACVLKIYVHL